MLSRSEKVRILYAMPWWAEYMATWKVRQGRGSGVWREVTAQDAVISYLRAHPGMSLETASLGKLHPEVPEHIRLACAGITDRWRKGRLPEDLVRKFAEWEPRRYRPRGFFQTPEMRERVLASLAVSEPSALPKDEREALGRMLRKFRTLPEDVRARLAPYVRVHSEEVT